MYYKILDGLRSCHGGNYTWVQGKKTIRIDDPFMCERGYHFTDEKHITHWVANNLTIYELRLAKGAKVHTSYWETDKYVSEQVILGKKIGTVTSNILDALNLHLINCTLNSMIRLAKTKNEKRIVLSIKNLLKSLKKDIVVVNNYYKIKARAGVIVANNALWSKIHSMHGLLDNYIRSIYSFKGSIKCYDRSTTQLFWKLITKKGK